MKEHPILFSTPMVQAILEGRKTQTRRIVKGFVPDFLNDIVGGPVWALEQYDIRFPYGKVGDVLWVRESSATTYAQAGPRIIRKVWYKADDPIIPENVKFKWKPSIHMPRSSCRLRLEIANIRVERLQEISVGDAIAEGIEGNGDPYGFKSYLDGGTGAAVYSYKTLWQSINGKESWEENPWVWVIEFKRI